VTTTLAITDLTLGEVITFTPLSASYYGETEPYGVVVVALGDDANVGSAYADVRPVDGQYDDAWSLYQGELDAGYATLSREVAQ
jgi:hypothetical protein